LNRVSHRLLTVRRKLLKFGMHLTRGLLLLTRQVLPGFHPIYNLLPLFWRAPAEVLQALLQLLLPCGWKFSKLRIIFKCALLLIWGHISVLPQPLS
jgi:hypothetical protein